jgi:PAS domain-containing protein
MNAPATAELAQALFCESTDALLIVDARTARICQTNAAAQDLLARDGDALTGIPLYDLLVADAEELHRLGTALSSAERWRAAHGVHIRAQSDRPAS